MRLPLLPAVLFVAVLFVIGCGDSPSPAEPDPAADEVFELMSSLSLDGINEAYARLDGFAYTTQIVLEELDENGEPTASASRIVRRIPTTDGVEETVLDADSSSSLSSRATASASQARRLPKREAFEGLLRPVNLLSSVLPDEPAYVRMRTRDRYAYEMRPDTTVNDERLHVAQATLRRESADKQPVRYARYYHNDTNTIVGVDVLRLTTSALFDETSHVTVWLLPGPDGVLLPGSAVSETTVHTPGNEPKRLRLTQTIRDITGVE
ncbi:MAG: hypothetical protein IH855_03860 [Bacteroidetes bacterium]|nr:hypothetical protein [Bacteroidota bacterium]